MRGKALLKYLIASTLLTGGIPGNVTAHEIYFCGEVIPTDRQFVANKLMKIIRDQMPVATLIRLRSDAQRYFPYITYYLRQAGIPEDFKYVPIVECGFRNLVSKAGARGFWQIMPEVAKEQGLYMSSTYDQRDDFLRATKAAVQIIIQHRAVLKKSLNNSSWILTAAAYNLGPGRLANVVRQQGPDYFNMQLNAETAEYVYRLIAVKELFEHPERYMKDFGTNIFGNMKPSAKTVDTPDFASLQHSPTVSARGDGTADFESHEYVPVPTASAADTDFSRIQIIFPKEGEQLKIKTKSFLVKARLVSNGRHIHNGQTLKFRLLESLTTSDFIRNKGNEVSGTAWIFEERLYVDFGLGDELELQDRKNERGMSLRQARKRRPHVLLKIEREIDG